MDPNGQYETYDSEQEEAGEDTEGDNNQDETTALSESSDSESEPEDSGYSNNENGPQELTLLDGPSVLIQPILDDEGDDDGRFSSKHCII